MIAYIKNSQMTALVAVLNKKAIALAADSAITHTSEDGSHKVINSANKLFALSKYHPVAVMYCGNVNFMETPWEVIIKLYRDELSEKTFPTIEEYRDDFLNFLRSNHFFCSEEKQKRLLRSQASKFYNIIENITNQTLGSSNGEYGAEFLRQLEVVATDDYQTCDGLTDFQVEDFINNHADLFQEIFNMYSTFFSDDSRKRMYERAFSNFIRRSNSNIDSSELVFVGYGGEQIFPSLRSVDIYFGFDDDQLRWIKYVDQDITEDSDAAISRYGQIDVINTISYGINPTLRDIVFQKFDELSSQLAQQLQSRAPELSGVQYDLSKYRQQFRDIVNKNIQSLFTDPLITTISYLDKEDMAELAESLISITHLKRRITSSEEGVGGPIDVAILSKGDGFIWKKRKHYFDPKLNQSFFDNYFRTK